ncbi:hypothetical protein KAH39_11390 [Alcaligenes faecalis]|uniref:hypothetical protein n=1 Tax=Alcaligenes faecalis TaxID=511 RepID=UPI000F65A918|nr:hypothetical protein [Alcaligenes faecalis]MBQ0217907.1 hypothetical protein [Alcaligenes faecalis]
MKQAICRPHTVLLITLGVNLIFCPVIASFPLIKERTSQRYSFSVSVPVASKKISLKVKTTKNIDIKQGLISTLHVLQTQLSCENTQFTQLLQAKQALCGHKYTLYPQNVDKSKIQTRLT